MAAEFEENHSVLFLVNNETAITYSANHRNTACIKEAGCSIWDHALMTNWSA